MTNSKLRKLFERKREFLKECKKAEKDSERAERIWSRLDEEMSLVQRVDEVYHGVCLSIPKNSGSVHLVLTDGTENDRWADYWQNVNDHAEWRITLKARGKCGYYGDVMSMYRLTRERAIRACKDWVARGIKPE